MIHFAHFGWRFAEAADSALHDVCLNIERGEFVVVAGPSGSGKTTLALAMCGLLVGRHDGQAAGMVRVDDLDVAATPLPEIARRIALVQQNPEAQFATLTVADEVAFGLENRCTAPDEIRRRSATAMDLLGVAQLRDRTLATLSGGEQQRVAIASIMAGEPDAIVLDEPTASLDPQASRDFFRVLADLCRHRRLTVVVIEHKLVHLLPHNPRLIQLAAGSIVDRIGPVAATSKTPPTFLSSTPLPVSVSSGMPSNPPSAIGNPQCSAPAQPAPAGISPLAELAHVTVRIDGRTILDDVNLIVLPGDVIAILGPNGGGKTTMLYCLLGLVKPDAGRVSVCGSTVTPRNVSERAARVGVVLQNADHQLVADSVFDEALFTTRVMSPRKREALWSRLLARMGVGQTPTTPILPDASRSGVADPGCWCENPFSHPPSRESVPAYRASRSGEPCLDDRCASLLEQAGILNRRDDHPYRLSWGQKRRLNLISAILHQPRLLLLDEPFAGQDWENAEFLMNMIRSVIADGGGEVSLSNVASGAEPRGACLLVTHDSRIVLRGCTRVVFVSDGRIVIDEPLPLAILRLREANLDAYVTDEPAC